MAYRRSGWIAVLAAGMAGIAWAQAPGQAPGQTPGQTPDPTPDPVLARLREAALHSDWAYERLADLTDTIGPRLSGSVQHAAAIVRVADAMRALGADVHLQPVKVPHWVRGEERAELVEYAGRPAGVVQRVHLVALGGSGATPPAGLTAPVIVLRSMEELHARASEVRGAIVLFEVPFDQHLADNGRAMTAYGQAGEYRFAGPSAAAALGAAAVLVRSVGGADFRLPHTGVTLWDPKQAPIPAAAVAAEDADLIARLAARGAVSAHVLLTPQRLPDADSANVIADWKGRERPEEVVIVSGHLDSWDLGTGAIDDGAGVMGAAGVLKALADADVHPRRTVRFIAWSNEENGSRGAAAYAASVKDTIGAQCAAIESDSGAGRALGIEASVTHAAMPALRAVRAALAPIGATVLDERVGEVGADIAPLQEAGVPGFAPLVDTRHYFDYHHTAADTLDKVDPAAFRTQVAVMAVLAYQLAELPQCLPRVPTER